MLAQIRRRAHPALQPCVLLRAIQANCPSWIEPCCRAASSSVASEGDSSADSEQRLTIKDVVALPGGIAKLIPQSHIRNFSVIAHIDHGKSTLSDCLLELTGNITAQEKKRTAQFTDTLKVERERGITVKAQTASMVYKWKAETYLLNLVDTPGHVDFSYEVSRSLNACEGALLLVDSTQGIQAQTLSTYTRAKDQGLVIIPVVTKADLPNALPEDVSLQIAATLDGNGHVDIDDVIVTSAKTGLGIEHVLPAVIERVPPPRGDPSQPLRCRLVDSWYDHTRGVVCLGQVVDGEIKEGDRISAVLLGATEVFSVQEVGVLCPYQVRTGRLSTGQVGYIVAGMRSTRQAQIGDTLYHFVSREAEPPPALPGFEKAKSMLYASVYPLDTQDFDSLELAINKLTLNDASVTVEREASSTALGSGLRCGFLGVLHMEVFNQRLQDEFGTAVLITSPMVPYKIEDHKSGTSHIIQNLSEWPEDRRNKEVTISEPMVEATVITPATCLGALTTCLKERRGVSVDTKYVDEQLVVLTYRIPWQEVVTDLHDVVKNVSAGYASLNYRDVGYEDGDLVKVEMAINGEAVDALSFVSHREKAEYVGRKIALKLKNVIDRQNFEIVIQARVGRKVLARERIPPFRKDVLTTKAGKSVGGGDITRKKKLLEKQKEGKKRAKMVGKVNLSQEAFWAVISKS